MHYVIYSDRFNLFIFMFLKLSLKNCIFLHGAEQLLLGYLPNDHEFWVQELDRKRSQYKDFKEEFLVNPVSLLEDPLIGYLFFEIMNLISMDLSASRLLVYFLISEMYMAHRNF